VEKVQNFLPIITIFLDINCGECFLYHLSTQIFPYQTLKKINIYAKKRGFYVAFIKLVGIVAALL